MSRKTQIIKAAMKLFAQKGYQATSMQEIAENSGLAKGSLYNYFKSKEEIAISIFKYYYDLLFEKISKIAEDDALSAKEKLLKQLEVQIHEFYNHKDFIHMQMTEQAVKVNDDVHKLVFCIRAETLSRYSNAIIDIYGESVKNFALDFATMLNGMLKEYLFYIAIDKKEINLDKLAPFLIKRLDAMVQSLTDKETPLLTDEVMKDYIDIGKTSKENVRKQIIRHIDEMIAKLEDERDKNYSDVIDSLNTLKQEFSRNEQEVRKFIVEALLLYLQNLQHIDLTRFVKGLKAKMDVYFTN
ncbi:TetR/AcrR family transcriptional regulator [Bacillus alveayuensis]|uniref:TetR/AcrR family transcriptional regulator n=1 Tax=Aeribacillus alveayuensis TaxID=279215 RepID=UPI0005D0F9C4|nr:TetR/AcrR family transcriptional regulator [Bacillus alveayuensis]